MSSISSKREEAPADFQWLRRYLAGARLGRRRARHQSAGKRKDDWMFSLNTERKGTCMRTLILPLALGTFAQGALAAEPNCRAIESTGARLSCYDAAFPLKLKEPRAVDNSAPQAEYKDPLIAEDARIAAKLKNICRGC
ncbi:type VI secretion protein [Bradyrhizobium sp. 2S1]|uniref:type VI secretion protein n=1 Tax=Bradyrhizobium sp. 2S1 TaxID=1404429 RepID=UPI001CD0DC8F|nr:type VI secretion protein [Bradyrhizobium sp. 2S1]MCK7665465.1 type VI secretion protein [Bradyrhizobium sp. 2S1]